MRYITCLFALIISISVFTIHAQNDVYTTSKHTKFSLLTCGPGEELYTRFGHTALRLHDDSVNIDVVFNYGLFDFNTPNFYLKFMNGELDYLLGYGSYGRFIASYTRENREVREAEIILSDNEKEVLWRLLSINLQPENRAYRYDFFFDNCATRVRDLLFKVKNIPLPYQPTGVTYRQLLHEKNTSNSWSAQGIDLLLGANTDSIASVSGRAFLPDYLEALCKENGLITTPKIVVNPIIEDEENIVNIPNLLFTLLILLTVLFTIYESKQKQLNKWFDITLLIPFILLSLLFMYMWFISSHLICKWNWNLLWASPILIILLISILKEIPAKRIMIQLALVDATLVAFIMLSIFAIEYFSNIAYLSAATLAIRVNYRLYYTYNLTFRKK